MGDPIDWEIDRFLGKGRGTSLNVSDVTRRLARAAYGFSSGASVSKIGEDRLVVRLGSLGSFEVLVRKLNGGS